VEELLAERGIPADHVTIYRVGATVHPELIDAARPSRHVAGDRWFVDETYLKVAGGWVYLYRAIDQHGQVIDVLAAPKRDLAATRRFFARAPNAARRPTEVTTDRPRRTRGCSTSLCPRRGTSWSSTPTTRLKPITAG
jgi:transposase, IS6 family